MKRLLLLALILLFASPAEAQVVPPSRGGTGLSTVPSYGQVLVGNSSGLYGLMATSSLGITGSGGSGFSTTSADAWLTTKSTDNLTEGSNLYYTLARFASALAGTTTDALTEGSNLYYTDARARAAISTTVTGLSYSSATGVLTLASGYTIPLTASTTEWATAYGWGDHASQNYFDRDTDDTGDLTEGSNLFYTNARVLTYLDTLSKGYFFATSSANYWETQQTARTADDLSDNDTGDLAEGANLYYTAARVNSLLNASTTLSLPLCSSGEILEWNGSRWACGADNTGGAPAWGTITGTLSDQTDLQSALDGKISVGTTSVGSITALLNLSITESQVSDLDHYTNTDVEAVINASTTLARTSDLHDAVTLAGSLDYLTLSGQELTRGSIDLTTDITGDLPFANLTQGSALSVLGRSANSTGDVASIAAGSDHQVLRRSGTSLAFGALNLAQSAATTGTLPVNRGGSGAATFTDGGILLGSGTGAFTAMSVLANGSIVVGDGTTDPVALAAFTNSTGDLRHEAGGLEADVSGYTNGLYGQLSGATADIDTESELYSALSDVSEFAETDEDETVTGAWTFSTATTTVSTALQLGSTSGDNLLKLAASRDYPASDSTGGMVNIDNTSNLASSLMIYTNAGVGRLNDVLRLRIDNAANDQRGLYISNDGTRSAALFDCNNATRVSGGECVNITDEAGANRTALGITGAPIGLGLLKFTVASGADASASALSVQIDDTDPQGIFMDTVAGYTGKLLNLRVNGTEYLTLDGSTGLLTVSNGIYSQASSTFSAGTTTIANASVTSGLNLFGTFGTALSDFCVAITGGSGLCDGTDDTGGGGGSSVHVDAGDYVYPYQGNYHSAPRYVSTSTSATSTFAGPVQITANGSYGGSNNNEGLLNLWMPDSYTGSLLNIQASSTAASGDGEIFRIEQYNANHSNEIIKIENSSTQGGSEEIYIQSTVPDVVLCDITDSANDCVEWEADNHGTWLMNSRNTANSSFERNVQIAAARLGGMVCIGGLFDCPFLSSKLTIVGTSTLDYLDINSVGDTTAGGDIFTITNAGYMGVGTSTPQSESHVVGTSTISNADGSSGLRIIPSSSASGTTTLQFF